MVVGGLVTVAALKLRHGGLLTFAHRESRCALHELRTARCIAGAVRQRLEAERHLHAARFTDRVRPGGRESQPATPL